MLFFQKGCVSMKRFFRGVLLFSLFLSFSLQSVPGAAVRVTLNGQEMTFETDPYIENGRVMVPLRGILEAMGYSVYWQSHTQTVLAINGTTSITMPLNSKTVTVNGETVPVDAPARLTDSRTFVPLRFLAEHSGATVTWDPNISTVSILSEAAKSQGMKASVVLIQTNKMQGSGVILSEDGLIATNFHVIENASTAQFIFNNGEIYQGEVTVVGLSPDEDIALLKLDKTGLTPAKTSTAYTVGEAVTAIGSPYGQRNKATTGTLTGFDQDIIASSAAIGHGSSGGGLFNAKEELLGITTSYGSNQYLTIPISRVLAVPQDVSLPLSSMKEYAYTPAPPKNLRYTAGEDGSAYVSWTPVYDADYYLVYISYYANGPYQKLHNDALKTDAWNWGFPQCFGVSINKDHSFHLKVSAVVNGKETAQSEALRVYLEK